MADQHITEVTPRAPKGTVRVEFTNRVELVIGVALDGEGGTHTLHASVLGGVVYCATHGHGCPVRRVVEDVLDLNYRNYDASWWEGWRQGRQLPTTP